MFVLWNHVEYTIERYLWSDVTVKFFTHEPLARDKCRGKREKLLQKSVTTPAGAQRIFGTDTYSLQWCHGTSKTIRLHLEFCASVMGSYEFQSLCWLCYVESKLADVSSVCSYPDSTAILLQYCRNIVRTLGSMLLYSIAPRLEMQIGLMLGQYWIAILIPRFVQDSYKTQIMFSRMNPILIECWMWVQINVMIN